VRAVGLAALAFVALAACSGQPEIVAPPPEPFVAPTTSAVASAAPSAIESAAPEAPPPPPAPAIPAGMAEMDLGAAGATWRGWVVIAPKAARVESDGADDARVAMDGLGALDLVISQHPRPLAQRKAGLLKSDGPKGLTVRHTILADVPEKLEWSSTRVGKGATVTSFYFFRNLQASGAALSCGTSFDGAASKEQLAAYESVCDSVRKK
jgi:hypothetical protein